MTKQELYTRVRKHLLTQMAKSMSGRQCAYRGAGGLKCAIGCLIPDDRYRKRLEGFSATSRVVVTAARISKEQIDLASALQIVHDNRKVDEWREALDRVAARFGLSSSPVRGARTDET